MRYLKYALKYFAIWVVIFSVLIGALGCAAKDNQYLNCEVPSLPLPDEFSDTILDPFGFLKCHTVDYAILHQNQKKTVIDANDRRLVRLFNMLARSEKEKLSDAYIWIYITTQEGNCRLEANGKYLEIGLLVNENSNQTIKKVYITGDTVFTEAYGLYSVSYPYMMLFYDACKDGSITLREQIYYSDAYTIAVDPWLDLLQYAGFW